MEDQEIVTKETRELTVNQRTKKYLNQIRNWAMFFAVLGFVGIGIMVVAGLFVSTIFSTMSSGESMPDGFQYIGLIYVVLAMVYLPPLIYLLKFSTKMQKAVYEIDNFSFEDAFKNLKSHFKFMGIFTIVMLVLYPLIMIFAFFAADMMK
ncbi:MAG: hypothetical protein GXO88_10215 [Chlorobi bacterium]|nr:hypothetical protein [Chlorobiota bacterium]